MNSATCGSFSFTWLWERLLHYRSGWGKPRGRLPIMMSDTVLQTYCLGCWGKRRELLLPATVMKKLFTTNQRLCFLSLQPLFVLSAWHACEHAPPARQTPLRRMLVVRELIIQRRRLLSAGPWQWKTRQIPLEDWASSPESLLKSSNKKKIVDLFEDQAGTLGLPLWGISTDQIKSCHRKLESLCLKQMTC